MNAESNAILQVMICETKHEIQGRVVTTPPPLVASVTKKHTIYIPSQPNLGQISRQGC